MKKLKLIALILFISFYANGQINVNPDPNGEPWILGSIPEVTPEVQLIINATPEMFQESFNPRDPIVNNSLQQYMPPVFGQDGESCSQASGIGYIFTYEINWARGGDASTGNDDVLYPPGFTYNYLNNGSYGVGSEILSGWQIVMEMGCPNNTNYGGDYINSTHWPSGYDLYSQAMQNRIESPYLIKFNTNPDQGMETLKQWLFDHNDEDEDIGGLASFRIYYEELSYGTYSSNGHALITAWDDGTDGNHMMTIVGYDEGLYYDLNGNGTQEDDEVGAFLVVNSWGTGYPGLGTGPGGYVYLPYKIFLDRVNTAYVIKVQEEYSPELSLRVKMTHSHRNKLRFYTQIGEDSSSEPDLWWLTGGYCETYFALDRKGGNFPLRGDGIEDPIDLELELSYFYANETYGRVFLNIINDQYDPDGTLKYLSLIDSRWNEKFELVTEYENYPIQNGDNILNIDYDLLSTPDYPFPLSTQSISTNKICRFDVSVSANSTLSIDPLAKLDFYNSVLTIPEGSTLDIDDFVTLTGKQGISRIDVFGSIVLGNNVQFKVEGGAQLILNFPNKNKSYLITGATFTGAELRSSCSDIEIDDCEFNTYGHIEINAGDVEVHNCTFIDGYIRVFSEEQKDNIASIHNNVFNNTTLSKTSLTVDNYFEFNIYQNEIGYYYATGIGIYNSGSSEGIHTNEIVGNEVYCNNISKANLKKTGIKIYNSNANILESNYVYNNEYGISCLDYSTTKITGLPSTYCSELPQKIINNTIYQVYLSGATFPIDFHKNQIYDDGPSTTFIYELPAPTIPIQCNVEDNYWGGLTDPSNYLVTNMTADWDPICTPFKSSPASNKFDSAVSMVVNGNYQPAEELFKEIVSDTLEANYRYASLNQLFALKGIYDQDYSGLKQYLDTNIIFQDSSVLSKMSNHISNKCDIKLENYQTAIDYFEDIIQNSESCEDSTFAVIDLGYLYISMNSNRSNTHFSCQFPHFIPSSINSFEADRDRLIDLLYGIKQSTDNDDDFENHNYPMLDNIKIFPNPATKDVNIEFSNAIDLNLSFAILDQTGKMLFESKNTDYTIGINSTRINLDNLNSGVYLISIKHNGISVITKKLIITK